VSPWRQFVEALRSPLAIVRLPRRSWRLLSLYMGLAAAVLAVSAWLIAANKDSLRALALEYLFPESWHFAVRYVIDRFLAEQQFAILANAIVGGSLLLVTVLLFYVKEIVSASYEEDAKLCDEPMEELPLWEQGWQEIKLFLFFVAVQASIFWIDYYPGAWRRPVALVLSYGFLFFMFAAPSLIAARLWPLDITAIFAANVVGIAWAAVAGTWLGAKMLGDFRATPRSRVPSRVVAWLVLAALLGWNGYRYGALVLSIHHKSQLLKCDYSVDTSSFGVDRPGLTALLDDDITLGVHFDVRITNPTEFKVEIEDNRLELRHGGELMGITKLSPLSVESGATVDQRVVLSLQMEPTKLAKGLDLLDLEDWEMTLYLEVAPHFELPVYLLRRDRN
jgi:MFS family permease